MEQTDAGGRNTQPQPAPAAASLETELQDVAAAVAAILADARAIDPVRDEFGHARSGYYSDAVTLLKVSAKLGHSIAALRGAKFEHNINVRREGASHKSGFAGEHGAEGDFKQYKGCEYDSSYRFHDGTYFVHGMGRLHIPENWDEERWRAGFPQKGEQGDPLPISKGSNGNFHVAAGPTVRSL